MEIIIIVIVLLIIFKTAKKNNSSSDILKKVQKTYLKCWDFDNHPTVKRHFEILEQTDPLYSKICQSGDYHSDTAYKFEALCLEDITLADEFSKLCERYKVPVKTYPTFKQLAIFYEKQSNPHLAIPVCEEAIRVGYSDDGTKNGMQGRLKRLEKKCNSGVQSL